MFSVVPTTRDSSTTHRSRRTTREKWTVTWFWSCVVAYLSVAVVRSRRILNSLFSTYGTGGGYWFRGFRTAFYRPKTMCHKKIVIKIKSIVMRTTNNVFRKVHKYIHFKWYFSQFDRKRNILEIFHYFHCFRSMKKWQISKPKIVYWIFNFSRVLYHVKVIRSFKICFQNYGQLKRKFSEISAFQTQRADAKDSKKCNKKSVWVTAV